jgi:hypothetical protein
LNLAPLDYEEGIVLIWKSRVKLLQLGWIKTFSLRIYNFSLWQACTHYVFCWKSRLTAYHSSTELHFILDKTSPRVSVCYYKVVVMKLVVVWVVGSCSHVDIDRRFRGVYCLYHQDDHGDSSSETSVSIYRTTPD